MQRFMHTNMFAQLHYLYKQDSHAQPICARKISQITKQIEPCLFKKLGSVSSRSNVDFWNFPLSTLYCVGAILQKDEIEVIKGYKEKVRATKEFPVVSFFSELDQNCNKFWLLVFLVTLHESENNSWPTHQKDIYSWTAVERCSRTELL